MLRNLHYQINGNWGFPKKRDTAIIKRKYIFYGPVQATLLSCKGFKFGKNAQKAFYIDKILKSNNIELIVVLYCDIY